ncbi:MAG TPA: glycosyltransferase [Thermoanaerobaculia bacterium]
MTAPEISVVLLTKDGGARFAEVLDGLFACDGIESAEVLVVDSGSTDGTAERAAAHPGVALHRIPAAEFGHGRTRNLGARLARGRRLVFLVQDATPAGPDFLRRLTAPLADPGVAAAYARQVARPEADPVERLYLEAVYPERPEERSGAGAARMGIQDMFFSNVASALWREVWERFPFDESLVMSEDQQWAKAALRAGWRIVYEPCAVVLHSHHYPLARVFQRNFDSGASLQGIAEDPLPALAAYELRQLAAGCRALARRGEAAWIPRLLAFEAARSAGFAAGRGERLLPRWLKRRLGLHKAWWERAGA